MFLRWRRSCATCGESADRTDLLAIVGAMASCCCRCHFRNAGLIAPVSELLLVHVDDRPRRVWRTMWNVGRVFALAVFLLCCGCVHSSPWVALAVRPFPTEDNHSLRVTLQKVGGAEVYMGTARRIWGTNQLEVTLPPFWPSGMHHLVLTMTDMSGCEIGTGQTLVDVPQSRRLPRPRANRRNAYLRQVSRVEAAVELTKFSARCSVDLSTTGAVPLTIEEDGVLRQCPLGKPCTLALSKGSRVRIRAESDPAVTFWSGACEQRHGDTCSFVVKEPTQVTASFVRPVCRRGACWHSPIPQGNYLAAIWGSDRANVWAAGAAGTLLHFDGRIWESVESGSDAFLSGLWGSGPRNVWACGSGGTMLHFDGQRWSSVPSGTTEDLKQLFGRSANSAWAVGARGVILHYDGQRWQRVPSGVTETLYGVYARDERMVWVVGDNGRLLRFDGERFHVEPSGTTSRLLGVWGRSLEDVWLFTDQSTMPLANARRKKESQTSRHPISGTNMDEGWLLDWSLRTYPIEQPPLKSRFISMADRAQFFHPENVGAAWMSDPSDIWIVGGNGTLYHFDGQRWSAAQTSPQDRIRSEVAWIGGLHDSDVWLMNSGSDPWHWDGIEWRRLGDIRSEPKLWRRFYDRLAFGERPLHLHPEIWFGERLSKWSIGKIWATTPDDVWLINRYGGLSHFDGQDWIDVDPENRSPAIAIWGAATDDVRLLRGDGSLRHFDGNSWRKESLPQGTKLLNSLWGSSRSDVWAVGQDGQILRYNGHIWNRVESPSRNTLNHVWGRTEKEVWAVGAGGTVLFFDGKSWSVDAVSGVTVSEWVSIWGSSRHDLWLLGSGGALIRYRPEQTTAPPHTP